MWTLGVGPLGLSQDQEGQGSHLLLSTSYLLLQGNPDARCDRLVLISHIYIGK